MNNEDIEILNINDNNNELLEELVIDKNDSVNENNNDNSFSIIKNYGEDLTAKTYITNPAIGREEEINKMILTLITPDKGALLVGKPGIGKTALVEGLGYRIQKGDVPDALKNSSLNIASLGVPVVALW